MSGRKWLPAIVLLAAMILPGCGGDVEQPVPRETEAPAETPEPAATMEQEPDDELEAEEVNTMTITVGDHQFTVTLEDNAAAAALKDHLPLTLDMSELNGNEKYNYMPFSLPTEPYSPGSIQTGDVMLYGDSCLVVFYKSFSTGYSYTRLGHIDDPAGLQDALGTGGVQMTIEN